MYWQYGQWEEKRLQKYIGRLEDEGYIIEECPLAEFHVDFVLELYWFSDFRGIARHVNATHIYIDREMGALYFLIGVSGRNANVFYYNTGFID